MKFLSEEFFDAWTAAARPTLGGATGSIAVKTEGGPDGKVNFTVAIDDGRVTGVSPGAQKGADLELTMPYDLAADLLRGDEDPAIAFMRGTLKLSGDMAMWLEILPVWRARHAAGDASAVAASTEF